MVDIAILISLPYTLADEILSMLKEAKKINYNKLKYRYRIRSIYVVSCLLKKNVGGVL